VLQQASATATGRLELVDAPLHEWPLPPKFSQQHLAVQWTDLVTRLQAAK